jgi:hypothetical protein
MFHPIKFFTDRYYRNAEMVSYWKTKDSVLAKLTVAPEGHYVMHMEGEKYPFPGYPRGALLFGGLSPLKHWIKNKIFNHIWYALEAGKSNEEIMQEINQESVPFIFDLGEKAKHDMVPFEKLVPPVKELWRAFEKVEEKTGSLRVRKWKEVLAFIFNEDDAYRMRFQWLAKFYDPNALWFKLAQKDPLEAFKMALEMAEQAEVIGDMKERQRLWKRGFMFLFQDPDFREAFLLLVKEIDWNKIRLSKADKYFFRAKYFKVDYPEYQY